MELLAAILATSLFGLAAALSVLAWAASRRFGERRFLIVGSAFGLVAAMAVLAIAAEADLVQAPWFDEAFALEPVPLGILLVALLLVYAAMTTAPGPRRDRGDGGP